MGFDGMAWLGLDKWQWNGWYARYGTGCNAVEELELDGLTCLAFMGYNGRVAVDEGGWKLKICES